MTPEQIAAIPAELKERKQWVWFKVYPSYTDAAGKFHKGRKMPFSADGRPADSNDPDTWSFFDEIVDKGLPAYCISEEDPYCLIDLDQIHPEPGEPEEEFASRKAAMDRMWDMIKERFPGYHEVSVSGEGFHIIGKAKLEQGLQSPSMDIWDRKRFTICTGNGSGLPQEFPQEILNSLIREARGKRKKSRPATESGPQIWSDEAVIERMKRSGGHSEIIAEGEGHLKLNKDTSVADYKIIATIFEFSGNSEQTLRLFEFLGYVREKKADNYPADTLEKALGNGVEYFDLDQFMQVLQEDIRRVTGTGLRLTPPVNGDRAHPPGEPKEIPHETSEALEEEIPEDNVIPPPRILPLDPTLLPTLLGEQDVGAQLLSALPKGLIRDMAYMFYRDSIYPIAEVSMMAGIMAFVMAVQRGYQGHGRKALNIYAILLAASSAGKAPIVDGIPAFMKEVGGRHLHDHWVGEQRSAGAITKTLKDNPRVVMLKTECGSWMNAMTDAKAAAFEKAVADALTALYSCGAGVFNPERKVTSDDKELEVIERPCFSIIGETQPGVLWNEVKGNGMVKGFLPRFLILEVDRRSIQVEMHHQQGISLKLVEEMRALFLAMAGRDVASRESEDRPGAKPQIVPLDEETLPIYLDYCRRCREFLLSRHQDDISINNAVYGKMGENALKLATLLAISEDWRNPKLKVRREHFEWAMEFVNHCGRNTVARLAEAAPENSTCARRAVIQKHIKAVVSTPHEVRMKNSKMIIHMSEPFFAENPKVIPVAWLRDKCVDSACFKECKNAAEFDNLLNQMLNDGEIVAVVSRKTMFEQQKIDRACIQAK